MLRIKHRLVSEPREHGTLTERTPYIKSMLHRDLALHPEALVLQGNHRVLIGGEEPEHAFNHSFRLAHFSLRSPGQYVHKLAINTLQHLAHNTLSEPISSFYLNHLALARKDFDSFSRNFHTFLPTYLEIIHHSKDKILDPLPYQGGSLRHTSRTSDTTALISNLMAYSEQLARQVNHNSPAIQNIEPIPAQLSLHALSDHERPLAKSSCLLNPITPQEVSLSLPPTPVQGPWALRLTGPIAYVECHQLTLHFRNGDQQTFHGFALHQMLKLQQGSSFLYHEYYYTFVKSLTPVEFLFYPPPSCPEILIDRLVLHLLMENSVHTICNRLFQENPFARESELRNTVLKLENKVSQLVRIRGWLQHQTEWIGSLLFPNK
ncbi:MAG: hypothetical protein HC904_16980 [Blastochloris sp.]|nr:hypothetical protein [Blastochloris sp.]